MDVKEKATVGLWILVVQIIQMETRKHSNGAAGSEKARPAPSVGRVRLGSPPGLDLP